MRCVQSMISCGLFLALLPACVEIGVHELDDGSPEDTAPANSDTGLDTGVGFDSEESDSGNSDTGEPFDSGQTDTGEPDPGEPGVAIVSFESQQVLEIREGSSRNLTVRVTGASVPLDAFRVSFLVAGSASGPSGQAADAADFRVSPVALSLDFASGETARTIEVTAIADGLAEEGLEDLQLRLLGLEDLGGSSVAAGLVEIGSGANTPRARMLTLVDGDAPDWGDGGVDGDLDDWTGQALLPPRRPFDPTAPHLRLAPPSEHGNPHSTEAYQVLVPGIPGHTVGQWVAVPHGTAAIVQVLKLAEHAWYAMHGPGTPSNYASPSAVPIGTELKEVLVEVMVSSQWEPARLHDGYRYDNHSYLPHLGFGSGNEVNWTAVNSQNVAVRDLIIYGSGVTTGEDKTPNIPAWNLKNSVQIDNLRFERIGMTGGDEDDFLRKLSGGNIGNSVGGLVRYHGRLKMYDSQLYAGSWAGGSGINNSGNPKWTIRAQPVSLDIRHPIQPLPWEAIYPSWEHLIYVDSPTGPDMYPALGTSGAALAFVNITYPARNHPTHPSSTWDNASGRWLGPRFSAQNTFLQLANRPEYNKNIETGDYGKSSSGDLVFIRTDVSEHGSAFTSPGEAIKVHGHNGRIYIKDCKALGSSRPDNPGWQGAPLALLIENYTGDSSGAFGPQGAYLIDAAGTGVLHTQQDLVIDGFEISGFSGDKPFWAMVGPRRVKLRKFRFHNLEGGRAQMTLNYARSGGVDGAAFIEEWDVADLVVQQADGSDGPAWTADFSEYPGWGNSQKIIDYYFQNWMRQGWTDHHGLTDADIDNMPTHGPAGYTQTNGLIAQQYHGFGSTQASGWVIDPSQGSPPWTGSAYDDDGEDPELPLVYLAAGAHWISEHQAATFEVEAPMSWSGRSMLTMRVAGAIERDSELRNATVERALQTPNLGDPNQPEQQWQLLDGPTFDTRIEPVLGRIISSTQQNARNAEVYLNAQGQVWEPTRTVFRLRPRVQGALSSGTKGLVLDLEEGDDRLQWEFPRASGQWVDVARSTGSRVGIRIIPAVDYPEDGFDTDVVTVDAASLRDGQVIEIPMTRRAGSNAQSLRLESRSTIEWSGPAPSAMSGQPSLVWASLLDTAQQDRISLQILDASAFRPGDVITATLRHTDPAQHLQSPRNGGFDTLRISLR